MSKLFKISYKQGSRTHYSEFEAVSWESAKAFIEAVTTCKVTEICEIVYFNKDVDIVDDLNYFTSLSLTVRNSEDSALHMKLYHIDKTLTEQQLHTLALEHLRVAGLTPHGVIASLKS